MIKFRWRSLFSRFKLGVWLILPIMGLLVWLGAGWMAERVLSHSYETSAYLQSGQPEVELSWTVTVTAIEATIERRRGVTEVTVRTAHSTLKELEIDVPVTEFTDIEAALSEELGLPREVINQLTRYRFD